MLLVLCRLPVSPDDLGDETARQAFVDFLSDRLSRLMEDARQQSSGGHALRVLVVVDYPSGDKWADTVHFAIQEKYSDTGVRYQRLKQVKAVEWEDIEAYLDALDSPVPQDFYEHMKGIYESLDRETVSFRELASLLSEQIGQPVPGA